ncbi:23S rRNA (guanine(1835)-N(2))-methyltransferase, partial [Salmonella enterica subsp. enterica serovar Kentucky]|nr:23S rRNA (guanine(1835)-N(2))-methyltransferase [Salmonella enterica subsp. enterica serovar Kentucky]
MTPQFYHSGGLMSHVDDGFRSLTLKRFPQTDDVNPLLAWEAADE